MPEPADDLFACILVVLHLLFPCRFDDFNAGNIRADDNQNPETSRVLRMWRDIESSKNGERRQTSGKIINQITRKFIKIGP
jgi:hypothetical protein